MFEFIKNLFGNRNERELQKLWPVVEEIKSYEPELEQLSDDELRGKTDEFKAIIQEGVAPIEERLKEIRGMLRGMATLPAGGDGAALSTEGENEALPAGGDGQVAEAPQKELTSEERQELNDEYDALEEEWIDIVEETLDELLPEAFAVVKETCKRLLGETWTAGGSEVTWGMVPYDVQLLGGVVLHRGTIAEMKTGEGKTLVATMPLYLNALAGRGAHLVTVNPYLAERDAEWMAPIYEFHGLTVDVVDRYKAHSAERRNAYRADITYGTNNEFGFDYLRDNSFVVDSNQLVQREHHYAIIDEIDSVLIDEARTPLIISGPVPEASHGRFDELQPIIDKLVYAQKKLVASLVSEAEEALENAEKAEAEGNNKEVSDYEDQAGLALLRASRGFPKNRKLQKLLGEAGVARLMQRTENFYLQDNAKRMPFVDQELYFALEEKNHAIEMSDKGRDFVSDKTGQDRDLFVMPDVGSEIAQLEEEHETKKRQLEEDLRADESLTQEKRDNKLMNDQRLLDKEFEEAKREIYNTYSDTAERLHAVEQLLKAYTLYEKDAEYIVQEGAVNIVDQHTGRVMPGRRYSDGLHQAIEAKENVQVQAATQTYATITLQNFFRMYNKLAGMTGTAVTEAEEFYKIYELDVIEVPTNEPIARDDKEDLIFKTKRAKYNAVLDEIEGFHENGQPVLVGTTSVDVSETISRMLKRRKIRHNVLNAKPERVAQESQIVAEAGRKGAVTIATNMAGRGTDIKLEDGVVERGGLAILGTERHESRRIDLQLRGRAGRQGDPGVSQFYVSLEDDLMRLFGQDRVARVMDKLNLEEDAVITHPWVTKSIQRAQSKVEQNNFAIRKRQLEYDDVLNAHREVIYNRRKHALLGDRLHSDLMDMLYDLVVKLVETHFSEGAADELREEVLRKLAFDFEVDRDMFVELGENGLIDRLYEKAAAIYKQKRDALAVPFHKSMKALVNRDGDTPPPERVVVDFTDGQRLLRAVASLDEALETNGHEVNDALERTAVLSHIDERWTDHLRKLDELREGIGLRSYGRKDPLLEYKMEAYQLFTELIEQIDESVVSFVFRAGPLVDTSSDGEGTRRRLDPKRARTQHEAAEHDYSIKTPAGGGQQQGGAERDPSAGNEPVVLDEEPGRNDKVTIQNPSTGETATLKYKYAKKKLKKGWSMIGT